MYYGEVYKTNCCNNYICQECSVLYDSGELRPHGSLPDVPILEARGCDSPEVCCTRCDANACAGKRKKAEEQMLASLSLDYDTHRPFMASHIVDCPYCQARDARLTLPLDMCIDVIW